MRRRLLCWAIVAALVTCCTAAANAQGFGGRMGGRAARGGRMGMGRQMNGGATTMPAGTAEGVAGTTQTVPGKLPAKLVSQGGEAGLPPGEALAPQTGPAGLADIKSLQDVPAVIDAAAAGQLNGVNIGNGLLTVGDGQYPGTSVLLPGIAGRRLQARGAQDAFDRGVPAALEGGMPNGPWHAGYYETAWGRPMPVVVPPTATHQTDYGWGISNTRVTRIWPQYSGPHTGYPYDPAAGVGANEQWRPAPYWPSDTSQFGVYYIRGPW